ncbi:hypothetical protein ACFT2C_22015 [Promicromonospora sp. NPDC057138]|uniref:hypothetical protein n=1 Tax=Promicromonospora sp. NPDC057138 TaxID=3346031 RepID=UPI00363CFC49
MRHIPDLHRISEAVAESFGAREVYGEPIERDGVLVIPAAHVWSSGGAGAGGPDHGAATAPDSPEGAPAEAAADRSEPDAGPHPRPDGGGGGVGFGRRAEPAGAFVVEGQAVRWVPAVNVNRIVLGGQVAFVLAAALVGWAVVRRRRG